MPAGNAAGPPAPAAQHYVLRGRVQQAPPTGPLRIEWRLFDTQGTEVARFANDHRATAAEWTEMPPPLRTAIAEAAVRAVNRYLDESEGLPPEIDVLPPVHIAGIDGAQGAGPQALRRSLEHHLEKAGLTIEETVSDRGVIILGAIETAPSPGRPGSPPVESLRVTWTVLRSDGREIGVLRQANDVPRGTLQRPWGDLAYLIAEAATPGIVELLQKAVQADAAGAAAARPDAPRPGVARSDAARGRSGAR